MCFRPFLGALIFGQGTIVMCQGILNRLKCGNPSNGSNCFRIELICLVVFQHQLTVDAAIPAAQDNQQRGALLQQILELTDILLDGYKTELEAVRQATGESAQYHELKHRYEMDRRAYIQPFGKYFLVFF